MSNATYFPGQTLGRGDLDIYLTDSNTYPTNTFSISYALYYIPDSGPNVLIGPAQRTPVNPAVGEYYAAMMVPPTATSGNYMVQWTFQQFANSSPQQVAQEFVIAANGQATLVTYTPAQADMIGRLRLLLRDQNPDKFYHFRPPESEGAIGKFDRIFGQIWEDAELLEYLERALDWFNMFPPLTQRLSSIDLLVQSMPTWRTAILWEAIVHACFALSANWVADEFDYSIGGVSLSIEKSQKYQALMENAEAQFDKATEAKQKTVLFIRGLQQPRFGIGVRSAFGPNVGRGVLSPRSFM
jgi:hypothetical protein